MVAKGVMVWLLLPQGRQHCLKSYEVTTHSELVKEVISGVLVLHEQPQVLEHLERGKGQPWSGPRNELLPDISLISLLPQMDSDSPSLLAHPTNFKVPLGVVPLPSFPSPTFQFLHKHH